MIHIALHDDGCGLSFHGHANYAPKGQDIVCAAVSILIHTMAIQAVQLKQDGLVAEAAYHLEPGNGHVYMVPGVDMQPLLLLMQTVTLGLRMLENQYPQHITFDGEDRAYIPEMNE